MAIQGLTVRGKVSLTCDAWQASNTDGYFAVTAHWIEEKLPNDWSLEGALIGFVRMNRSHHGTRLGQALYKVASRVGIADKVCYHEIDIGERILTADTQIFVVTCDNASANLTMMRAFASMVRNNHGIEFNALRQRIG